MAAADAEGDGGGSSGVAAGKRSSVPGREQLGADAKFDSAEARSTAPLTTRDADAAQATAGCAEASRREAAAAPGNLPDDAAPGTSAPACARADTEAAVDEPVKLRGGGKEAVSPKQTGLKGRKRKEPDKAGAKQQSIRSFFRVPS